MPIKNPGITSGLGSLGWNCVGSLGRGWAAGQLAGWRCLWVDACPRQPGSQTARHKGTFLCFRTCLLDHLSFFLSFRLLSSTLLLLTTVARWSISFFIGIFFLFKGLSIKERFQIDSRGIHKRHSWKIWNWFILSSFTDHCKAMVNFLFCEWC